MGLGVRDELLASEGAGLILPSDTSRKPEASDSESRLVSRRARSSTGLGFFALLDAATTCFGAGGGDSAEGT